MQIGGLTIWRKKDLNSDFYGFELCSLEKYMSVLRDEISIMGNIEAVESSFDSMVALIHLKDGVLR